jgi:hypothetical protein
MLSIHITDVLYKDQESLAKWLGLKRGNLQSTELKRGPTRPTIKGTVCHLHVWIARDIAVEQISYGMPGGTFNDIVACEPHLGLWRSSTISFVLLFHVQLTIKEDTMKEKR